VRTQVDHAARLLTRVDVHADLPHLAVNVKSSTTQFFRLLRSASTPTARAARTSDPEWPQSLGEDDAEAPQGGQEGEGETEPPEEEAAGDGHHTPDRVVSVTVRAPEILLRLEDDFGGSKLVDAGVRGISGSFATRSAGMTLGVEIQGLHITDRHPLGDPAFAQLLAPAAPGEQADEVCN
jgi:hypothetical protein